MALALLEGKGRASSLLGQEPAREDSVAAASPPLPAGLHRGEGVQGPSVCPAISGCFGDRHGAFLLKRLSAILVLTKSGQVFQGQAAVHK